MVAYIRNLLYEEATYTHTIFNHYVCVCSCNETGKSRVARAFRFKLNVNPTFVSFVIHPCRTFFFLAIFVCLCIYFLAILSYFFFHFFVFLSSPRKRKKKNAAGCVKEVQMWLLFNSKISELWWCATITISHVYKYICI